MWLDDVWRRLSQDRHPVSSLMGLLIGFSRPQVRFCEGSRSLIEYPSYSPDCTIPSLPQLLVTLWQNERLSDDRSVQGHQDHGSQIVSTGYCTYLHVTRPGYCDMSDQWSKRLSH